MANLKEIGISLIAQNLGLDFNTDADISLYTVPTGKEFTPFAICISSASANMTNAVASFGLSSAKTDFLGNGKCEVREFPDQRPEAGQAVIRMKSSGICGSDL